MEEFFNAHQALGWDRAGTCNLNIRYGQMTMALVAQAATAVETVKAHLTVAPVVLAEIGAATVVDVTAVVMVVIVATTATVVAMVIAAAITDSVPRSAAAGKNESVECAAASIAAGSAFDTL